METKQIRQVLETFKGTTKQGQCFINDLINDPPDDVICDIAIYADNTTLNSKCVWAFDLWQQLELAFELESDLQRHGGLG